MFPTTGVTAPVNEFCYIPSGAKYLSWLNEQGEEQIMCIERLHRLVAEDLRRKVDDFRKANPCLAQAVVATYKVDGLLAAAKLVMESQKLSMIQAMAWVRELQ